MKIKQRIKEHSPLLVALALTLILYFVVYAIYGIFPFGKGTFSHYDGIHQVDPFLKHLSNVLYGKDSFSFSFRFAGGLDMVGSLIYICFSPFTLIYMVFGWGNIHYVTNFVMILRSLAMLVAFYYMLRKIYPKLTSKKIQFLLLLSYLTCGYFAANNSWYSWIDYLIYLPLLVVAFKHMIEKHKIVPFTVMLCLTITPSVSLSIQCYIIGLLLLCLYPIMILDKEERNIALKNIILSSLLAVIILSPAIITMLSVVKDTVRLTTGNAFTSEAYLSGYSGKYAFMLLDFILVGVAVCGLFRKNKDDREKYFTASLPIALLPIVVDKIAVLISFGKYFGYFYRFGFMYQILLFCFVCYLLEKRCEEGVTFAPTTKKEHRWLYVFLGLTILVALVGCFLCLQDHYFSSAQASGAIIACLLLIYWPILLFVIFFWRGTNKGTITKRMLTIFLSCFYAIQLLLFGGSIVGGGSYNLAIYEIYGDILAQYNLQGKRVKIVGDYDQNIMGVSLDFIENDAFTSSMNAVNLIPSRALSFDTNNVHCVRSNGGTILSDCVMGYDYYITDIPTNLPYMDLLGTHDKYYIYHNTLSLSGGFTVENVDLNITDTMYITEKQNALYHFLGGEGNIASNTSLYPYLPEEIYERTNNNTSYDFFAKKVEEKISDITIPVEAGKQYYIVGDFLPVFEKYRIAGKEYDLRSEYMIDLGYVEEDRNITFDLITREYVEYAVYHNYYLEILSIDVDLVTNTLNKVVTTSGNIQAKNKTLSWDFTANSPYYVLPYTYHEEFGESCTTNKLGFIITTLQKGEVAYKSSKLSLLLKMIVIAFVLAVAVSITIKLGWFNWLSKYSFVLAMLYIAGVLCVLCFAGLGLEIISWIKLVIPFA